MENRELVTSADQVSTPSRTQPAVLICLLGRFQILKHGHPIPVRQGGKVERMVGALATHPREGMARATLIHAIWPDADYSTAGNSLNSLAYLLKNQLCDALEGAPPVIRRSGRYSLALGEGLRLDTLEFDRFIESGHRSSMAGDNQG